MTNEQIILLITTIAIFLLLLTIGILLLNGKGANLIAGYNTMPKEKKAKYNKAALTKFFGIAILILNLLFVGIMVGIILECFIVSWICAGLFLAFTIFIIIHANTGNRFKNSE